MSETPVEPTPTETEPAEGMRIYGHDNVRYTAIEQPGGCSGMHIVFTNVGGLKIYCRSVDGTERLVCLYAPNQWTRVEPIGSTSIEVTDYAGF